MSEIRVFFSKFPWLSLWKAAQIQEKYCDRKKNGLHDHYIKMPITSFDGPFLGFKKSRSRGKDEKLRQKGKDEKEDKTMKREKPPHTKCGGFSGSFLTVKLGKFWNFDLFLAHWLRLWPLKYTACIRDNVWLVGLDGQNHQSPIASVPRTQSTLASQSAAPRGTNVKRMNANRAIWIAAERTLGLSGLIFVLGEDIWPPTNASDSNRSDNSH